MDEREPGAEDGFQPVGDGAPAESEAGDFNPPAEDPVSDFPEEGGDSDSRTIEEIVRDAHEKCFAGDHDDKTLEDAASALTAADAADLKRALDDGDAVAMRGILNGAMDDAAEEDEAGRDKFLEYMMAGRGPSRSAANGMAGAAQGQKQAQGGEDESGKDSSDAQGEEKEERTTATTNAASSNARSPSGQAAEDPEPEQEEVKESLLAELMR